MATTARDKAIEQLRRVLRVGDPAEESDCTLLGRFLDERDESAFEIMMRRHGPMVWAVCRRILRHPQDAEDAFQASFLVFVRKAATVRPRAMLGNWLHGVARQTAIRLRSLSAKRTGREKQVASMPEPQASAGSLPADWQELFDQELSRLPDKYRIVVIVCDLEGKSGKEAARQLGWPEGSVWGRLARGRAMLTKRLARHGPLLPSALLAAELSRNAASACLPAALMSATIRAAVIAAGQTTSTGLISTKVAALTEGVLRAMLLTKLKKLASVCVFVVLFGAGASACYLNAQSPREDAPSKAGAPRAAADQTLPSLTKEQLLTLLRTSAAPKVERVLFKYFSEHCELTGLEPREEGTRISPYSPQSNEYCQRVLSLPVKVKPDSQWDEVESWIEFGSGKQFFHLQLKGVRAGLSEFRYQFDGREVKTLVKGVNAPKSHCTITKTLPPELKFEGHWRPERVTLLPFAGTDLITALNKATGFRLSQDKVDDETVYVVTVMSTIHVEREIDGKAHSGETFQLSRFWLSPKYNLMPVRVENCHYRDENDLEGEAYQIHLPREYKEIEPGIWMPRSVRIYLFFSNAAPLVSQATIQETLVNGKAMPPAPLEFPQGAAVHDEIRGKLTTGDILEDLLLYLDMGMMGVETLHAALMDFVRPYKRLVLGKNGT
jgi:RNA polymerase sigma factor (sigma-70 family)